MDELLGQQASSREVFIKMGWGKCTEKPRPRRSGKSASEESRELTLIRELPPAS